MRLKYKLNFTLKHPVAVIKYLITRDLNYIRNARRIDIISNTFKALFGSITKAEIVRYLLELEEMKVYEYIMDLSKLWPKVDSSKMMLYKGSLIYSLIRYLKPSIVVETGVASGVSTYLVLLALERNNKGLLYSIDLPNVDVEASIPPGKMPGWIIPCGLRSRWNLVLGDAKQILPILVKRLNNIDVFIHDSLHTYEHMIFEFKTTWPYLRHGGLLISDDACANNAFTDFNSEVSARSGAKVLYFIDSKINFGIARKL